MKKTEIKIINIENKLNTETAAQKSLEIIEALLFDFGLPNLKEWILDEDQKNRNYAVSVFSFVINFISTFQIFASCILRILHSSFPDVSSIFFV